MTTETIETIPVSLEEQIATLEEEMETVVKKNASNKGAMNGFPALAHQYVSLQTRLDVLYDKQQKKETQRQMKAIIDEITPVLRQQDWTEVPKTSTGYVNMVYHFPGTKYPEGKLNILGV